jgi:hypothetical protein
MATPVANATQTIEPIASFVVRHIVATTSFDNARTAWGIDCSVPVRAANAVEAQRLGQACDLLIENGTEIVGRLRRLNQSSLRAGSPVFVLASPQGGHPRLERDSPGYPVQPRTEVVAIDVAVALHEHEKGCLKGILGRVAVAKHATTHAKHHRSVATQQNVKRSLVTLAGKAAQQLLVGKLLKRGPCRQLREPGRQSVLCHQTLGSRRRARRCCTVLPNDGPLRGKKE